MKTLQNIPNNIVLNKIESLQILELNTETNYFNVEIAEGSKLSPIKLIPKLDKQVLNLKI